MKKALIYLLIFFSIQVIASISSIIIFDFAFHGRETIRIGSDLIDVSTLSLFISSIITIVVFLKNKSVIPYLYKFNKRTLFRSLFIPIILSASIFVPFTLIDEFSINIGLPQIYTGQNIYTNSIIAIILTCILGPVSEELVFRGAIISQLYSQKSETFSIICSAIIFSIIHINPVQFISTFLAGLVLGWIFLKAKSLYPCFIIHIINNSIYVVFLDFYGMNYKLTDLMNMETTIFFCIISVIVFFICIVYINASSKSFSQNKVS
ncbi:MAG: CPBP family intramembrane metalloprotease [Prevotella sp.]|jgi:membrane protease YdiL (CAAX protease family)|nr:CPBP family intramembrane metalloprotease [Prevotella sp.]